MRRISIRATEETLRRLDALATADHRDWPNQAALLLEQAIAAEEKRRARKAEAHRGQPARGTGPTAAEALS